MVSQQDAFLSGPLSRPLHEDYPQAAALIARSPHKDEASSILEKFENSPV